MNQNYFYELDDKTNEAVKYYKNINKEINHEEVANNFMAYLEQKYDDEDFCKLLSCAGFIPDSYEPDSSEETLFSKLVEVLVSEWAVRMDFNGKFVKEKSSYEDVNFTINEKTVVCDAKSFRLGRSQGAPNVKDFLKLQSFRDWLNRYDNPLGGLVVYPDTHDWERGSDVYQHATTKNCPVIILPYIYLALLLHYKDRYNTLKIQKLWNYEKLFPQALPKKMKGGNRKPYWDKINAVLMNIIGINKQEYNNYLLKCKNFQRQCIKSKLEKLENQKQKIIQHIKDECQLLDTKELRKELIDYKISKETEKLNALIQNINKFRL